MGDIESFFFSEKDLLANIRNAATRCLIRRADPPPSQNVQVSALYRGVWVHHAGLAHFEIADILSPSINPPARKGLEFVLALKFPTFFFRTIGNLPVHARYSGFPLLTTYFPPPFVKFNCPKA